MLAGAWQLWPAPARRCAGRRGSEPRGGLLVTPSAGFSSWRVSSGDGSASSSAMSAFRGSEFAEVRGDAPTLPKGQQVMARGIKAAG